MYNLSVIIMHANNHHDYVLPANHNSLAHDNSALDRLKNESDRLMELLISQDLVLTAVNSLAAINDYKSMEQNYVDEFKELFTINEFHAQLEAKNVSIAKLKEHIANLKGKNVVKSVQNKNNSYVVDRPDSH
ncbi:hypothetical protein Tco_0100977, partial [Tanacetum coccineum]